MCEKIECKNDVQLFKKLITDPAIPYIINISQIIKIFFGIHHVFKGESFYSPPQIIVPIVIKDILINIYYFYGINNNGYGGCIVQCARKNGSLIEHNYSYDRHLHPKSSWYGWYAPENLKFLKISQKITTQVHKLNIYSICKNKLYQNYICYNYLIKNLLWREY